MLESIGKLQVVMSHASHYLLTASKAFYKPALNTQWFDLVSQLWLFCPLEFSGLAIWKKGKILKP
jgi:hypothetical protein